MNERILSRKEREWVYDKWCLGYTQEQIADALCVSRKTIVRAIHKRPKIRPMLVCDIKDEEVQKKIAERRETWQSQY